MRYLDIHEDDHLDETQFADWVKQASQAANELPARYAVRLNHIQCPESSQRA